MEVVANGLTKSFGRKVVVQQADLTLPEGKVTVLVGMNGAGKSTLMRLMLGLVKGAGTTLYGTRPLNEHPDPAKVVGAHLEGRVGHPQRTAAQHLSMVTALNHISAARVTEVLGLVGLEQAAHRRIGGFSLGMRQRLGLATALAAEPLVLFLDEPVNGLDVAGKLQLLDLLRQRAREGGTILLSSHALAEMDRVADRVVVMSDGRVLCADSLPDLLARFGGRSTVARSPEPEDLARVLRAEGMEPAGISGDELTVAGDRAADVALAAQRGGVLLTGLATRDVTLEEAYLCVLAGAARPGQAGAAPEPAAERVLQ